MRRNLLPAIGIVLLVSVAVLAGTVSASLRGSIAAGARAIARAPLAFFRVTVTGGAGEQIDVLIAENARLKAEVLFLANEPRPVGPEARPELRAKVHSTYPTNNRGLVSVNAGSDEGVREGMPVTVDGFTFLGITEKVGKNWSSVRTRFDTGWQLPVKVGGDAVDALLIGGREPRLTLIVKSGKVGDGDSIYTASKEVPYGLKIGEVKGVLGNSGSAFQEAGVILPYDANLSEVLILL